MCNEQAKVIHNTFRIIAANRLACAIFRCSEFDLVDVSMLDIIADPDMRGLAKLRLKEMHRHELRSQDLPIFRPDGTKFWATVQSYRLDDHTFETTIKYLYEIP